MSSMVVPDNVWKRVLRNVYFILGDGADVADELSRRYGFFVYHTCEHRHKHSQNADPRLQPGLCRSTPDFFALDPEEAMRHERQTVRDFTPMVIIDLIQLSAKYEKVICENDIDIDCILPIATHAVMISNKKSWSDFLAKYEREIRRRDISEKDKEDLVRKMLTVWGNGKPENLRGTTEPAVKQVVRNDDSAVEQTADIIAEYFGWPHA